MAKMKDENLLSWGEKNGTKDRLAKRNKEIVNRYYSGVTAAELGIMYFLSEKRIGYSFWQGCRKKGIGNDKSH